METDAAARAAPQWLRTLLPAVLERGDDTCLRREAVRHARR
jgi:hypothetical protein